MTVNIKTLKPALLEAHEVDFGSSIAQSIWQKIGDYQNWTNSNIPIGYVLFFYGSQTFADGTPIPKPNPSLWHLCDGSTIVDAESPLDGITPPDLKKVYLKGGTTFGLTGGQTTINLSHNHGTTLVTENDESGTSNADQGGDYVAGSPHTHTVATRWPSAEPIIPPTRELQIYIRKK